MAGIDDVLVGMFGLIEEVAIEVTVMVVVKKDGLCAKAGKVESVFPGFVAVPGDAVLIFSLAYQQLIMADGEAIEVSYFTDIDIEPAVVVYIDDGDAGGPAAVLWDGGFCDVGEVKTAVV